MLVTSTFWGTESLPRSLLISQRSDKQPSSVLVEWHHLVWSVGSGIVRSSVQTNDFLQVLLTGSLNSTHQIPYFLVKGCLNRKPCQKYVCHLLPVNCLSFTTPGEPGLCGLHVAVLSNGVNLQKLKTALTEKLSSEPTKIELSQEEAKSVGCLSSSHPRQEDVGMTFCLREQLSDHSLEHP